MNFESLINRKKVKKVARFSKYLIFNFTDSSTLIIHLGMSGTIHILKNKKNNTITNTSFYHSALLPKKHNHIIFFFNKFKLIYNDPRRFGFFLFFKDKKNILEKFKNYGPEPFSNLFNINYIQKYFNNKEKNIKSFLLDQKFVSGLGNIYANEVLFFSKISPLSKAKNLNKKECEKIIYFSKLVLKNAITKGGSSIRNFKDTKGVQGSFQKNFKVYQREGLACKRLLCNGQIQKKNISNRSTFFCNNCQK